MKKKYCRYRPPQYPQHDLALIKVDKPIKFSETIMPICLPPTDKFPDEKGIVYVAGWHEPTKELDCTTGEHGPDPFSNCKFPFFFDKVRGLRFRQCLRSKSPSAMNKDCKELYNLMIKRNGNITSFLDNYGRVNTLKIKVFYMTFDILINAFRFKV